MWGREIATAIEAFYSEIQIDRPDYVGRQDGGDPVYDTTIVVVWGANDFFRKGARKRVVENDLTNDGRWESVERLGATLAKCTRPIVIGPGDSTAWNCHWDVDGLTTRAIDFFRHKGIPTMNPVDGYLAAPRVDRWHVENCLFVKELFATCIFRTEQVAQTLQRLRGCRLAQSYRSSETVLPGEEWDVLPIEMIRNDTMGATHAELRQTVREAEAEDQKLLREAVATSSEVPAPNSLVEFLRLQATRASSRSRVRCLYTHRTTW
jgi:hypothetical protein